MTNAVNEAVRAIGGLVTQGDELAGATRREMYLQACKAEKKADAIRRIMQTPNEETNKAHSASSAEKIVESDREYRAFLASQCDAVCEKIKAQAMYDAAKLTAQLSVKLVDVEREALAV